MTKLTDIILKISHSETINCRPQGSVILLAASKGQSIEKIQALCQEGLHRFGENYLQEALPKIAALVKENIEWHFIGSIQPNKTKKIAEHFDWVQSVSSLSIAERLNKQRPASLPPLNICIQINSDQEATKSGVSPEDALPLIDACFKLDHVRVRGIMAIPKPTGHAFSVLHELFSELQKIHPSLDTLSMGMSADFEEAIKEGSTLIRMGTALFGPR